LLNTLWSVTTTVAIGDDEKAVKQAVIGGGEVPRGYGDTLRTPSPQDQKVSVLTGILG